LTDWAPAAATITRRYRLDKWIYPPEDLPLTGKMRTEPLPLPMRVEMFWRRENFKPVIPMNLYVIKRLKLALDVPALKEALRQLAARHEPLRSELLMVEGHPAQRIVPDYLPELEVLDLSSLDTARREEEEARLMLAFAQQDIDLFAGPTFRARLLRLGHGEFVLGVLLHHYFGDAKSLSVLFGDLVSLYASITSGTSSQLPALRWCYADYALWQRTFAAPRLGDYLGYWEQRLADVPWLGLSPQGEADARRSGMFAFPVSKDLSAKLGETARQTKTTLFAVTLAAYQLALSAFSDKRDVVTAIPVAARARRDFANTVGYLMNALPVRTHIEPSASVAEHLKIFGQKLMADYFRQDISYELLEDGLPGPQPLSTNMFNFIPMGFGQPLSGWGEGAILDYAQPAFEAAMRRQPRVRVMKDFVFFLTETPRGLDGLILYNKDYFDEPRIRGLAERFVEQLERIAAAAPVF
jgi:hypothetical protein